MRMLSPRMGNDTIKAKAKDSFGKLPTPKGEPGRVKAITAALDKAKGQAKSQYVYSSGNLRTMIARRGENKMIES